MYRKSGSDGRDSHLVYGASECSYVWNESRNEWNRNGVKIRNNTMLSIPWHTLYYFTVQIFSRFKTFLCFSFY